MSSRLSRASLPVVVAAALVACGGHGTGSPDASGEEFGAGTTARASEPGIARVQEAIARHRAAEEIDTAARDWKNGHVPLRPVAVFDRSRTFVWTLETSEGRIRVLLWPAKAPDHVSNLVYLTLLGFYDDLPLYAVEPGKGVLGGCPVGDGRGSPGYAFGTGPESAAKHDREGLLSAVSLGPGTDDSKFRLTLGADPSLDERSTVYGEVVEGLDVLRRIGALGTPEGRPSRVVTVRRATITVR